MNPRLSVWTFQTFVRCLVYSILFSRWLKLFPKCLVLVVKIHLSHCFCFCVCVCVRVCVSVCNCRAADEKGDAIPAVKKATHTHTDAPKRMQSRRRINRWALSQGAKQITSRYDICRQADRGGRSVPAGREQQLTAPSPGISFHSWRWEEEDGGGFRLGFPVFSLLQTYIF